VRPRVGPPDQPTDLGEIALEVPPLVVAGRVLNPNGAPLVCSLVVYQPAQEASGRAAGNRRERWRVRTDSSGYFAVNGHGSDLPVSFQLTSESYELLESEPVPAGSAQVVLRTAFRSSLRFRMRGNSAEQGSELEARLVSVGPNGERDVRTSNWDRFGAVQIPKLIPGSYTLEIGQKTVPEVVFWNQTFEIQPGESMDLGDIPLDVELHTYKVEFVLLEGASEEEFRVAHGLAFGTPVPARIHRTAGREYTLKSTQRLDQVEITQSEQPAYRRRFDVQPGANRLRVP